MHTIIEKARYRRGSHGGQENNEEKKGKEEN